MEAFDFYLVPYLVKTMCFPVFTRCDIVKNSAASNLN